MKITKIVLLVLMFICCVGCANRSELTLNLDNGTFTQGGRIISNDKAMRYLQKPSNSESEITIIETGSEPAVMTIKLFSQEAEKLTDAINDYYFPDKSAFDDSAFEVAPTTQNSLFNNPYILN